MTPRSKALVCVVVAGAIASLTSARGHPAHHWLHFFVYLTAIVLSSGMKIAMPKSNGTMCVNFPFILLGIVELSPYQAIALAVCSVIAQCRIRVVRPFTLVQILFNVANVVTATVLAWYTFAGLLHVHSEVAPALAAAASVYFLANTVPVAVIIAWESGGVPFRHWRQEYIWYFPFYLVGAVLAAAANFISVRFGWMTSLLLIPVVYIIYRAYCAQRAMVRDRERHIVEMEALHLRTIEGLAMAVEAKDKNTHRHLMRVRVYVSEMGKLMGLEPSLMKALETASVLHDIGKLAVPEHIINKPGKLTREEFEKMKIHPGVGADMVARIRFPYPVVPIVRSHHEAWDGSGYPDGLKGEEIPIGARILTAIDCFDALASDRPYRRALPLDEAMAFLKNKAGQQFDPKIVELLEGHFREFEEMARQQINEMAPLETEVSVERGLAPGAGFAPEHDAGDSGETDKSSQDRSSGANAASSGNGLSDLVAAAAEEAQALFERNRSAENSLSAVETSAAISRVIEPFVPFDCFAVYVKSEESIRALYIIGPFAAAFSARPIPIGEGLSGWVAHNELPIVNGNPTVEPNFLKALGLFTAESSALSVPLFTLGGPVLGALTVYSAKPAAFSKQHLNILEAVKTKFALALQCALELETAETQARALSHSKAEPAAQGSSKL
jgi:putative nucleotidyltransferase with HDIG domain